MRKSVWLSALIAVALIASAVGAASVARRLDGTTVLESAIIRAGLTMNKPTTVVYRVGTASVNVGSATAQTVYTVPTGYSFVPTRIVVHSASGTFNQGTDPVFSVGCNGTSYNDIVASATYTTPSATTSHISLTIGAGADVCDSTEVVKVNVTTAATASTTATFDLFGYLH